MINASELREGNLVTVDESFHEEYGYLFFENLTVVRKDSDMVRVCRSCGCCYEDITREAVVPIELTDEWLKRFGIEEKMHGENWGPGDQQCYGFKLSDNLFLVKNKMRDGSDRWDGYHLTVKNGLVFRQVLDCQLIRTVHRLQNIVFAILGQELTLIEPVCA